MNVSDQSMISIGYSPLSLLVLSVVAFVAIPIPIFFSLQRVQGVMVSGGSSSLVISAACHSFSSVWLAKQDSGNETEAEHDGEFDRISLVPRCLLIPVR